MYQTFQPQQQPPVLQQQIQQNYVSTANDYLSSSLVGNQRPPLPPSNRGNQHIQSFTNSSPRTETSSSMTSNTYSNNTKQNTATTNATTTATTTAPTFSDNTDNDYKLFAPVSPLRIAEELTFHHNNNNSNNNNSNSIDDDLDIRMTNLAVSASASVNLSYCEEENNALNNLRRLSVSSFESGKTSRQQEKNPFGAIGTKVPGSPRYSSNVSEVSYISLDETKLSNWFFALFPDLSPELVQLFVKQFNDNGFMNVQDLIDLYNLGNNNFALKTFAEFCPSLKIGHFARIYNAIKKRV